MSALSSIGEKGLIERISKKIRTDRRVIKGIGDDCAVLEGWGGRYQLFASDMLVEGVHFLRSTSPQGIGWKALAVNVSDIAAMGGIPRHAVISLGLPRNTKVSFVDGLYQGLARCANRFSVNLVGGDTNRSGKMVVDVAILGEVEPDRVIYRCGAKPGDALFVTGRLGGAVQSGKHLSFIPRVREARAIGEKFKLHALIDLSDGLGLDLTRICEASGVAAQINAASIPRRLGSSLQSAFTEGEDFELLMAVADRDADHLETWGRKHLSCGIAWIGRVLSWKGGTKIQIIAPRGMKVPASLSGFQHF